MRTLVPFMELFFSTLANNLCHIHSFVPTGLPGAHDLTNPKDSGVAREWRNKKVEALAKQKHFLLLRKDLPTDIRLLSVRITFSPSNAQKKKNLQNC